MVVNFIAPSIINLRMDKIYLKNLLSFHSILETVNFTETIFQSFSTKRIIPGHFGYVDRSAEGLYQCFPNCGDVNQQGVHGTL